MKGILLLSAGRRVELAKIIKRELQDLVPGSRLIVADANPEMSAVCRIGDFECRRVERVDSGKYIDNIVRVCLADNVGLVIPTIDTELLILSRNRSMFKALGIQVMVSDELFVTESLNKLSCLGLFDSLGIKYASRYETPSDVVSDCVVRPARGSSSVGLAYFKKEEARRLDVFNDDHIVQERIGEGFTEESIDLYYDQEGILVDYSIRERIRTRSGEISIGRVYSEDIDGFVTSKLKTLKGARGIITFQRFRKGNEFRAIEINARVAGGYPMSDRCGCKMVRMAIKEYLLGLHAQRNGGPRKDGLCLRYDRTLVVNDEADYV